MASSGANSRTVGGGGEEEEAGSLERGIPTDPSGGYTIDGSPPGGEVRGEITT